MTSRCGSADVLEALGVKIDLTPEQVAACLERDGHRLHVRARLPPGDEVRRRPAPRDRHPHRVQHPRPADQSGGRDPRRCWASPSPRWPRRWRRCWAASAASTPSSCTARTVWTRSPSAPRRWSGRWLGALRPLKVDPSDAGLSPADASAVRGGSSEENAAALRRVLSGERGPLRDFTLLNAAAGLVAGDRAASLSEGIALAAEAIDGGAAREALERFVSVSSSFA